MRSLPPAAVRAPGGALLLVVLLLAPAAAAQEGALPVGKPEAAPGVTAVPTASPAQKKARTQKRKERKTGRTQKGERAQAAKEKIKEAHLLADQVKTALGRTTRRLDSARGDRDPLRLSCISERHDQMAALLKVIEGSLEKLKAAADKNQNDIVEHEYGRIVIAKGKVEGFAVEAEQCTGSLAFNESEEVQRSFQDEGSDDTTFKLDPTDPQAVPGAGYRPPPASPTTE